MGQAVSYALPEYKRLVRYLKSAHLTPDNGFAERAVRPFAVGRNWLFNNFEKLPEANTEEKLEELLPWNMTGIPPYKPNTGEN